MHDTNTKNPDSEQQFMGHTDCCPVWDLNPPHLAQRLFKPLGQPWNM